MSEHQRIRVEMLLADKKPRLYISNDAAARLLDIGIATFKRKSRSEMNLRPGWLVFYDQNGLLKLDRPSISQSYIPIPDRILERKLRMRLNCESWNFRAPVLADIRELFDPRCFYPVVIA